MHPIWPQTPISKYFPLCAWESEIPVQTVMEQPSHQLPYLGSIFFTAQLIQNWPALIECVLWSICSWIIDEIEWVETAKGKRGREDRQMILTCSDFVWNPVSALFNRVTWPCWSHPSAKPHLSTSPPSDHRASSAHRRTAETHHPPPIIGRSTSDFLYVRQKEMYLNTVQKCTEQEIYISN